MSRARFKIRLSRDLACRDSMQVRYQRVIRQSMNYLAKQKVYALESNLGEGVGGVESLLYSRGRTWGFK